MDENRYWLAGKVNVPEDKKAEFNTYVMAILRRFGIRKRKEINVEGEKITVLGEPIPDKNGIVSFDYSIFEKKNRDISTYNMNTCELHSIDRGENEYGLAMNCILALQESYSNGSCFFMEKRKPVEIYVYMCLLSNILNKKINNNSRGKIWDMLLLLRKTPDTDLPSRQDIFRKVFPFDYSQIEHFQLLSMLPVYYETEPPTTDKDAITDRTQIKGSTYISQREYLYRIMAEEYQVDKKRIENFLKKLLCLPMPDREKLAETEDNFGAIAELSLYVPPTCVVSTVALLEKKPFWDTWDKLVTGSSYTDIDGEDDEEEKLSEEWVKVPFNKIIFRKNEDELLEFWDGENLILSDNMKERIQVWKELIDKQEDQPTLRVEPYLGETLAYIEKEWPCRYIDETFVEKILNHQDDPAWRKILLVLRRIVDDGIELFPEMNRKMAVLWLESTRMPFDATAIAAYCSLMENDVARQRVFGF